MCILSQNKNQKLGFNKNDILLLLDKFNLKHQNTYGQNALMYIISYNISQGLGFNRSDILNIIDKFDLSQKNINNMGVYDFFKETKYFFSKKKLIIHSGCLYFNIKPVLLK